MLFFLFAEFYTSQLVAAQQVHAGAEWRNWQEFLVDDQSRCQAGQIRPSQVSPDCQRFASFSVFLSLLTTNCQECRVCIVFVAQSYYYGEHREPRETTRPFEEDRRGSEERRIAGRAHVQPQQQRRRRSGLIPRQSPAAHQRISTLLWLPVKNRAFIYFRL